MSRGELTPTTQSPSSTIGINHSYSPIKKAGKHLQKKHIRNAHEIEKQRRLKTILSKMRSWLTDQSPLTEKTFHAIITCVKKIVKKMGFKFNKLLMPTIMYADKYICNSREKIHYDHLFQLLITSAIVAVKMWEDTGADMEMASYLTNIPKKDFGAMERDFLQKLNYELVLSTEDIEEFESDNQEPGAGQVILPIATTAAY